HDRTGAHRPPATDQPENGQKNQNNGPQRLRAAGRPADAVPDLLDDLHGLQAVPGDLLADAALAASPPHPRQFHPGDEWPGVRHRIGLAVLPQQPRRHDHDRRPGLAGLAARLGRGGPVPVPVPGLLPDHALDRADDSRAGTRHRAVPRLQSARPAAEPERPGARLHRAGTPRLHMDAAQLRRHGAQGTRGGRGGGRGRADAHLLAHPVPPGRPRPGSDQHLLVHHRLQRVHRGAHVPGPGALGLHPADLRDLFLQPRRRGMGPDHGCLHPVHDPRGGVLPAGSAAPRGRPGRRGGEGVSADLSADPALSKLADAILIPPFPGPDVPRWVLAALERGLAGVTVFGPNIADPEQVAKLTAQLRSAGGVPLIAIDEEGGDVTRIAHLTGSRYPGNAALGAVDDVALTADVYRALGTDLAALGFNVDLAPSVDVNTAADNPVIGTRSFGADTGLVSRHAGAAVSGLQAAGVAACAKHFPGHGSTRLDTHDTLVTVEASLELLTRRDLPPFTAAIKAGVRCVMPGHLRVPELTGDLPATLSAAALTGLLRGERGFSGVIISDALEMRAVSGRYGIPEAAVRAAAAGTDVLCLGRDQSEDSYLAVRHALCAAVGTGRLPAARLAEAAARVADLRAWLASAGPAAASGAPASTAPSERAQVGLRAARRAVQVSGPVRPLTDPVVIEVSGRENIAVGGVPWGLGPWLPAAAIQRVPASLAESGVPALVDAAVARAAGRPVIVVVRDAHRYPVTRA